jgi:F-type H+-transporting ATPase subunit delta
MQSRFGESAKLAGETILVAGMPGRYATALFELARDAQNLDETARGLATLEALLNDSEDLARLVRSPIFSAAEQSAAFTAIADKTDVTPLVANFLQLLIQNRRLFALRDIIAAFRLLLAHHRNEITADVSSAIPLSDQQADELKATLRAKTGKDIALNLRVDPALLGGLIVKMGSLMIDASVRTKLNSLKIAMKEVG